MGLLSLPTKADFAALSQNERLSLWMTTLQTLFTTPNSNNDDVISFVQSNAPLIGEHGPTVLSMAFIHCFTMPGIPYDPALVYFTLLKADSKFDQALALVRTEVSKKLAPLASNWRTRPSEREQATKILSVVVPENISQIIAAANNTPVPRVLPSSPDAIRQIASSLQATTIVEVLDYGDNDLQQSAVFLAPFVAENDAPLMLCWVLVEVLANTEHDALAASCADSLLAITTRYHDRVWVNTVEASGFGAALSRSKAQSAAPAISPPTPIADLSDTLQLISLCVHTDNPTVEQYKSLIENLVATIEQTPNARRDISAALCQGIDSKLSKLRAQFIPPDEEEDPPSHPRSPSNQAGLPTVDIASLATRLAEYIEQVAQFIDKKDAYPQQQNIVCAIADAPTREVQYALVQGLTFFADAEAIEQGWAEIEASLHDIPYTIPSAPVSTARRLPPVDQLVVVTQHEGLRSFRFIAPSNQMVMYPTLDYLENPTNDLNELAAAIALAATSKTQSVEAHILAYLHHTKTFTLNGEKIPLAEFCFWAALCNCNLTKVCDAVLSSDASRVVKSIGGVRTFVEVILAALGDPSRQVTPNTLAETLQRMTWPIHAQSPIAADLAYELISQLTHALTNPLPANRARRYWESLNKTLNAAFDLIRAPATKRAEIENLWCAIERVPEDYLLAYAPLNIEVLPNIESVLDGAGKMPWATAVLLAKHSSEQYLQGILSSNVLAKKLTAIQCGFRKAQTTQSSKIIESILKECGMYQWYALPQRKGACHALATSALAAEQVLLWVHYTDRKSKKVSTQWATRLLEKTLERPNLDSSCEGIRDWLCKRTSVSAVIKHFLDVASDGSNPPLVRYHAIELLCNNSLTPGAPAPTFEQQVGERAVFLLEDEKENGDVRALMGSLLSRYFVTLLDKYLVRTSTEWQLRYSHYQGLPIASRSAPISMQVAALVLSTDRNVLFQVLPSLASYCRTAPNGSSPSERFEELRQYGAQIELALEQAVVAENGHAPYKSDAEYLLTLSRK